MNDENNDENAYNRTMNIAGHFITLFLNIHAAKKLQHMMKMQKNI